jgi:hypothetical protein
VPTWRSGTDLLPFMQITDKVVKKEPAVQWTVFINGFGKNILK